jgi:hypothetical protein
MPLGCSAEAVTVNTPSRIEQDIALLHDFVTGFVVDEFDTYGRENGQPVGCSTLPSSLLLLYAVLPGSFPPLYEQLVLSYRWTQAELPWYTLLANPAGADLDGLFKQIQADPGLSDVLIPSGYIQFGRGSGGSYDPVCFDTRHRHKDGDCRVVQIDHEQILCNGRIIEVSEVARSFREIVEKSLRHNLSKRAT